MRVPIAAAIYFMKRKFSVLIVLIVSAPLLAGCLIAETVGRNVLTDIVVEVALNAVKNSGDYIQVQDREGCDEINDSDHTLCEEIQD